MFYGLPTVMRMFAPVLKPGTEAPLTIREGRLFMERLMAGREERSGIEAHKIWQKVPDGKSGKH